MRFPTSNSETQEIRHGNLHSLFVYKVWTGILTAFLQITLEIPVQPIYRWWGRQRVGGEEQQTPTLYLKFWQPVKEILQTSLEIPIQPISSMRCWTSHSETQEIHHENLHFLFVYQVWTGIEIIPQDHLGDWFPSTLLSVMRRKTPTNIKFLNQHRPPNWNWGFGSLWRNSFRPPWRFQPNSFTDDLMNIKFRYTGDIPAKTLDSWKQDQNQDRLWSSLQI